MMKLSIAVPALALAALAGCGDEDGASDQYTSSVEKHRTAADDSVIVPARAVPVDTTLDPPPPQAAFAIALGPLPGHALRGTGRVAAVGKETAVSVALERGMPGHSYAGAVRQGDCSAIGPSVGSLNPVSAGGTGRGGAASSVPVPVDSITRSPHVVVYGPGGRPETCAPIAPAAPPPVP